MRRYWGVGLGEGGRYVSHGLKGGYFAIGSGELLGDVSWLKEVDWDRLRKAYMEKYPDIPQPQSGFGAGLVYRLVVEVREGDIILLRNSQESCINIGVVGPYYYDATPSDGCPYRHRRRVDWGKMILREKMSHNLKASLGVPAAIIDLNRYADEIEILLGQPVTAPPSAAIPTPAVGLPPSPTTPGPPPLPPEVSKHEQLVETLIKVGRQLGKPADRGTKEHDNIDVIWGYMPPWQPLTHIFEVQDKGVLHSALGKLQGAIAKLPGLKPYLVLVDPGEKRAALKLVQQNYPALQGRIRFVAGSTVEAIHAALEAGEDIKDLFS